LRWLPLPRLEIRLNVFFGEIMRIRARCVLR